MVQLDLSGLAQIDNYLSSKPDRSYSVHLDSYKEK